MDSSDTEYLEFLVTEQVRPELSILDELSVEDLVDVMCADVRRIPDSLVPAQFAIVQAVTAIVERFERGGRLIYVGAGTAGRLGMLDAAEAGPTFNVDEGLVVGVLAGGTNAFGVPIENAEDDFEGGVEVIRGLSVTELDCVVGISASGRTPYVLGAVKGARSAGALTVGVACNLNTPLGHDVDCPIEVAVGPELIAGSTRMNSGTVQKIVLNVISTATMVRLGKTYGNLMIDLRPTNEKLRDRSVRIVSRISEASVDEAQRALEASGWKPKVASAMLIGHVNADEATQRLTLNGGRLRPTLDSLRSNSTREPQDRSTTQTWTRLGVKAAFVNGALVDGDVAIHHGEIVAVGLSHPGTGIAVSGFVDTQINGYFGVDLLNAEVDEILTMGDALLRDGVVAYQPTLITSEFDQVQRAVQRIDEARNRQVGGAKILGIHLEGPFLSPRRAGTHPISHLRAPDVALLQKLLNVGRVSMITIAPELEGAIELIQLCRKRGVIVSLGHSAATSEEAERGFDAGASAVTHLFNAMEPLSARFAGLAGASLTRNDVAIQLIADGVHVSDEMLRMAFSAAPGRCSLVSDDIAAAGGDKDVVQLGDVDVRIKDGVARRTDGTIAGSIGKLGDGLARLGQLGIANPEAISAVTSRPAQLLHVPHLVSMAPGSSANFFVLNDELRITKYVTANGVFEIT
jgi:N-acetylglucosamine-6-phosphate deacetylase